MKSFIDDSFIMHDEIIGAAKTVPINSNYKACGFDKF